MDTYVLFTTLLMGVLGMMAWSIMYRNNQWYRIVEDLTIGVMGGYIFYISAYSVYIQNVLAFIRGDLLQFIPILLGVVLCLQVTQRYRFLARLPMALITGVGVAIMMKGAIYGNILTPMAAMATPQSDITSTINNVVASLATITTVMYFFFTVKSTSQAGKALGKVGKLGRYFMMVAFGSVAGSSLLSNSTFIYNRAQFYVLTPWAWVTMVAAGLVLLYDIIRTSRVTKPTTQAAT